MPDDPESRSLSAPDFARAGCLSVALLPALAMSGLTLWFAILREDQMFWRNAGGWPVEFRDLVESSFYPLAGGTTLGLFLLGWAILRRNRLTPGLWFCQALVLSVCVILLTAGGVIAFANNISNLWQGKPLHEHPEVLIPSPR